MSTARLVFGLGRSGLGVLRFLARRGLPARFYDERPRPQDLEAARALGFLEDPNPRPGAYREVIAAPGVPIDHPLLNRLREAGAEVIGEAELAYRHVPTPLIGVTGTAGKGSTTLFTAHLLRACGLHAVAGGNLDPPLVDVVEDAEVAVVELSSFQLERVVHFTPKVAVLLNLGVDHLDRHRTPEAYHRAKLNLLKNLTDQHALVYNAADPLVRQAARHSPARLYPFTPGPTPRETNLEAAYWAARAYLEGAGLEVDEARLRAARATAPSLPGRFEAFGRVGGVVFIDDSIATRTLAVQAALAAAPAPIAWILGGVNKGADLECLRPLVARKVRVLLAIGRDGPRMAARFRDLVEVVEIPEAEGNAALERAIAEALARIQRGSVLLAPLAASFDQFADYKARSRAFREAAQRIGGAAWTPSSP